MSTPLIDPPEIHTLPVSWHADTVVDLVNHDPGDAALTPPVWTELAYEDGVEVRIDVKTDPPQTFTAQVSGAHAVVRIESEVADTLKSGLLWVALSIYPGVPSTAVPMVNGVVQRYDGKTV